MRNMRRPSPRRTAVVKCGMDGPDEERWVSSAPSMLSQDETEGGGGEWPVGGACTGVWLVLGLFDPRTHLQSLKSGGLALPAFECF